MKKPMNDKAYCWGSNVYGESDIPSTHLIAATQLATGSGHTCAVDPKFNLACWGWNENGQLDAPEEFTTNIKYVVPAAGFTCAVSRKGSLECWGLDTKDTIKIPLNRRTEVQQVSGGFHSICGIFFEHRVLDCFGLNSHGNLDIPRPYKRKITMVAVGHSHSCALHENSNLRCWGFNIEGLTSVPPGFITNITKVTTGYVHSCAVRKDQTMTCWGSNQFQQNDVPEEVKSVTDVALGFGHTCVVMKPEKALKVQCWGSEDFTQTTVPKVVTHFAKNIISGGDYNCVYSENMVISCFGKVEINLREERGFKQFSAGFFRICTINQDDLMNCYKSKGVSKSNSNIPGVRLVSSGYTNVCYILIENSQLFCSKGDKDLGVENVPEPLQVGATAVEVGAGFACGLNALLTIYCWGTDTDDHGQTAISETLVVQFSTGYFHSCLIKSDDLEHLNVKCWGQNEFGQIDVPETLRDEGYKVQKVSAGGKYSCALDQSLHVTCWGRLKSFDDLINGGKKYIDLDSGWYMACLVTEDNEPICYGNDKNSSQIAEYQ